MHQYTIVSSRVGQPSVPLYSLQCGSHSKPLTGLLGSIVMVVGHAAEERMRRVEVVVVQADCVATEAVSEAVVGAEAADELAVDAVAADAVAADAVAAEAARPHVALAGQRRSSML
jgi:hypothetical protein